MFCGCQQPHFLCVLEEPSHKRFYFSVDVTERNCWVRKQTPQCGGSDKNNLLYICLLTTGGAVFLTTSDDQTRDSRSLIGSSMHTYIKVFFLVCRVTSTDPSKFPHLSERYLVYHWCQFSRKAFCGMSSESCL